MNADRLEQTLPLLVEKDHGAMLPVFVLALGRGDDGSVGALGITYLRGGRPVGVIPVGVIPVGVIPMRELAIDGAHDVLNEGTVCSRICLTEDEEREEQCSNRSSSVRSMELAHG